MVTIKSNTLQRHLRLTLTKAKLFHLVCKATGLPTKSILENEKQFFEQKN